MAEDVTAGVLADEVAQVCAESHVCSGALVVVPLLDWNPFEEYESLAFNKVVLNVCQNLPELWKNEVALKLSEMPLLKIDNDIPLKCQSEGCHQR